MKCLSCFKEIDSAYVACVKSNFCPFCGGGIVLPANLMDDTRKELKSCITDAVDNIGAEATQILIDAIISNIKRLGCLTKVDLAVEEHTRITEELLQYEHLSNPTLSAMLKEYDSTIKGKEPEELKQRKIKSHQAIVSGGGTFKKIDAKDPDYVPEPPCQFNKDEIVPALLDETKSERIWPINAHEFLTKQARNSLNNVLTGVRGVFKRHT